MRHYFGIGGGKGLRIEEDEQVDLFIAHPLPWSVKYNRQFPQWHEKSSPSVIDANGVLVFQSQQYVGHTGIYDMLADQVCKMIVTSIEFRYQEMQKM